MSSLYSNERRGRHRSGNYYRLSGRVAGELLLHKLLIKCLYLHEQATEACKTIVKMLSKVNIRYCRHESENYYNNNLTGSL